MTGDLPLLGFGLPVSGRWATPDTIRRTARRAEELGYASLWTFQRVLYPAAGELGPSHRVGARPGRPARARRGAHRPDPSGDGDHLRAVHRSRAAREDADVAGRAVRRPAHRGSRDGLAAAGVRRRRRALRAARRADGRVPALPGGAVDAGPGRVRRRVLHRAAFARGPAARATTAPAGAAGRRRCAGTAPRRAARPGLDLQQPAGPHRPRRVDRDGARRRARGRARPGGRADRGARRRRPRRRRPRAAAPAAPGDAGAGARRSRGAARAGRHGGLPRPQPLARVPRRRRGAALEHAERVLDAFAPTRLRPSA